MQGEGAARQGGGRGVWLSVPVSGAHWGDRQPNRSARHGSNNNDPQRLLSDPDKLAGMLFLNLSHSAKHAKHFCLRAAAAACKPKALCIQHSQA